MYVIIDINIAGLCISTMGVRGGRGVGHLIQFCMPIFPLVYETLALAIFLEHISFAGTILLMNIPLAGAVFRKSGGHENHAYA